MNMQNTNAERFQLYIKSTWWRHQARVVTSCGCKLTYPASLPVLWQCPVWSVPLPAVPERARRANSSRRCSNRLKEFQMNRITKRMSITIKRRKFWLMYWGTQNEGVKSTWPSSGALYCALTAVASFDTANFTDFASLRRHQMAVHERNEPQTATVQTATLSWKDTSWRLILWQQPTRISSYAVFTATRVFKIHTRNTHAHVWHAQIAHPIRQRSVPTRRTEQSMQWCRCPGCQSNHRGREPSDPSSGCPEVPGCSGTSWSTSRDPPFWQQIGVLRLGMLKALLSISVVLKLNEI